MLRTFGAPGRYVQGPGAISQLGALISAAGDQPVVIADSVVMDLLGETLRSGLGSLAERTSFLQFNGECSANEIARLTAACQNASIVIGVGGGKAIDAAKGVRISLKCPLAIVPTIASNDSPTSRLVVVYSESHTLEEVRLMESNPDLVLVDTAIIISAPERFFVSGIGDALSKKFEAEQCFVTGGLNFYKALPPFIAPTLGEFCYQAIREHAEGALGALRRGEINEHFERTVEATVLLSGLAFENGGLSIAHSLTRGFSATPQLSRALHGEQVAYGLLVQLILEGRDLTFLRDLSSFYQRVGLPQKLERLGFQGEPQALEPLARTIAKVSWEKAPYVRSLNHPVNEELIFRAIMHVESGYLDTY